MPLKPAAELLQAAFMGKYALGYFESWNLESLQGAIDAAELTRSPLIIGFNGNFLTLEGRLVEERIAWYGALGRAAAASTFVPCALIFNECPLDSAIHQAIRAGFNMVMPADTEPSIEAYARRVAALVQFAHPLGVAVEAEIGELPSGALGEGQERLPSTTDPRLAARFAAQTGVDLLAVSVGNVHILLDGRQSLDLDRLTAIRKSTQVPFGLHGGSGIADESLKAAIQLGVAKVNYGTYIKQRYLRALREALGSAAANPHELLGMGGADDILVAGRLAVRDAILERIELLGCCGKA